MPHTDGCNSTLTTSFNYFSHNIGNNNEVLENQTDKMKDELVAVTTNDFTIVTENRQAREEAVSYTHLV